MSAARLSVLVHGGFHGAWCWDRLIPELERLGHRAIAIDLPGHGTRRDEEVTVANRRDAVLAVVEPGDVLVGHSGGGFEITLAGDAAPEKVSHLIYLAAVLPAEGRSLLDVIGGETAAAAGGNAGVKDSLASAVSLDGFTRLDARGRMECCDFAAVRRYFYHDVDEPTARWAYDRLTPAPLEFLTEPVSLPRFWAADLPRSFILCEQDRAGGGLAFHRNFAARLGVEPLSIDSAHSPFLSKPQALAELMIRATGTRPIRPPSQS